MGKGGEDRARQREKRGEVPSSSKLLSPDIEADSRG